MHLLAPRRPVPGRRRSRGRWAAVVVSLVCGLAVAAGALLAESKKPTAPKSAKLTTLVTDLSGLALSPNFGAVGAYSINQAGDFAFLVASNALFVRRAGDAAAVRLLQANDPAPLLPDRQCGSISSPIINSGGRIAFAADVHTMTGSIQRAIYVHDGTQLLLFAHSEQIAPGTGGTSFGRSLGPIGYNDSGLLAFSAAVTDPGQLTLYLGDGEDGPVRVVGPGDDAPGTSGGTLEGIAGQAVNSAGEVLFTASVAGGNGGRGVFVASADDVRKVVSHGDPLPDPLVGTFDFTGGLPTPRLNDVGQVAFSNQNRIFVDTPGSGLELVVAGGDPVGPPVGGEIGASGVSLMAFNAAGQVAFAAQVTGSHVTTGSGLFRFTPGTGIDPVAWRDLAAPGTDGSFTGFGGAASMNASGAVTFLGSLTGASAARGFFQQSPGLDPVKLVLEGETTPLAGHGTFGLLLSAATQTLDDGRAVFLADVLDGAATAGAFLASASAIASLVSTEDPLPAGARVSVNTWAVGAGGNVVAFRGILNGGQESLWLCDVNTGKLTRIMADGDAIPGMAGRLRNSTTSYMTANATGEVAFLARLVGGPGYGGNGIFLRTRAGTLVKVVAQGDSEPVSGRTFSSISWNASPPAPLNNAGQVVFRASLAGVATGVFVGAAGTTPVKVALSGEAAPLTPTATFTSFGSATINNAGQVAFAAFTSDSRRGFYVAKPGEAPAKVVASGDPGPDGSTFPTTMPTAFGFNDRGEVAFMTPVVGGPGGGAFVGTAGGPLVPVALNGALAPSGGSFAITAAQPSIHMNDAGDVVFRTGLTGGTADSGLFLIRRADAVARTIALQGQVAPGTGGTFSTLLTALNNVPGENATLTSGGEVWTSQLVLSSSGATTVVHFRLGIDNTLERMFGRGDLVSQSNAGTIVRTIQVEPTGVDASGAYCFWAGLMGGKTSEAIFVTK